MPGNCFDASSATVDTSPFQITAYHDWEGNHERSLIARTFIRLASPHR